jgi:hypothetical protein
MRQEKTTMPVTSPGYVLYLLWWCTITAPGIVPGAGGEGNQLTNQPVTCYRPVISTGTKAWG